MRKTAGILLLSQPGQLDITPAEMFAALPAPLRGVPVVTAEIDMVEIARHAVRSGDFTAAQHELERQFRDKVQPLRERHPDYRVVYFGSAPVPLAACLGFLLETWQGVEIVPHHHARREWGWFDDDTESPRPLKADLPDYKDRTPGEAILRVSTSHQVDPLLTRRAVPGALVEIDVALEPPAEDAFARLDDMVRVAEAFRRALDLLGDSFPGVEKVHLFASVQPGIALLLGAQLSNTMHPPVQTYQYIRNAEDSPQHIPALLINGPRRAAPPPLTGDDEARAARDRDCLKRDLERMKGFAGKEMGGGHPGWCSSALSRPEGHASFSGAWRDLPLLSGTPLQRTTIGLERVVEDSFRLTQENAWKIDDRWLSRLAWRLPEDEERQRALRMLVLHELAHRGPQRLTSTASEQMGRFPKVLEEMDYHADVWAMIYEHALTSLSAPSEVVDAGAFFRGLIRTATQTMWAFDDDGLPLQCIQIRRLNRYLIWYWQSLRLEIEGGASLHDVLAVLAQRPILEVAGPDVQARGGRVYFALDERHVRLPELAVYHAGRLHRHGERPGFHVRDLLEGVRRRAPEQILSVLRAAVEQTVG